MIHYKIIYFRRKTYSAVENQEKYDKIHQYLFNRKSKPTEISESPPEVKKKEDPRPATLKITEEKTTPNNDRDDNLKDETVMSPMKPGVPLPFLAELQARKRSFSKPREASPFTKITEPTTSVKHQPEKSTIYVEKSASQPEKSANICEKSANEITTNAKTNVTILTNDLEEKERQDSAQNVNSLKTENTLKDKNTNGPNNTAVVNDVMQHKLNGSEKVQLEQNVQKTSVHNVQSLNNQPVHNVLVVPTSQNVQTSNVQPVRNVQAVPTTQNVQQSINTTPTTSTRPIQSVQPNNVQTAIVQPVQSTQPPKRNSVIQIVPPQINTQPTPTIVEPDNLPR